MPTNWKKESNRINSETFVLPAGWTSRSDVAKELDCSEDRVDDSLRAGLNSGRFIKQTHKVWNEMLGRCVPVIAYHDTAEDGVKEADVATIKTLKAEGKSYAEIGKVVGKNGEAVRAILRRAN